MKRDPKQAIAELEQALALDFSHIDLHYLYLGDLHAAEQDYPRAIWAWEQFLRFGGDEEMKAEVQSRIDRHTE